MPEAQGRAHLRNLEEAAALPPESRSMSRLLHPARGCFLPLRSWFFASLPRLKLDFVLHLPPP